MSQTTTPVLNNNASGSKPLPDGVDAMVTWIKNWFLGPPFNKDVRGIPIATANGLGSGQMTGNGQQPGVYIKLTDVKGKFWKGALERQGNDLNNVTGCVVLNTTIPNSGSTLWLGLIFHEYGHAALGADEMYAWTAELISLQAYLAAQNADPALAQTLKTFVRARRGEHCYSRFMNQHEAQAKSAYAALAGQAL